MESDQQYKIFFIGDCAATIDFGNEIDEEINRKVITVFNYLSQYPLNGMIEAITAYSSITIYFDIGLLRKRIHPEQKVFDYMISELQQLMQNDFAGSEMKKNLVRIPVCYEKEFALDVQWIAEQKRYVSRRYHSFTLLETISCLYDWIFTWFCLYGTSRRTNCNPTESTTSDN